jgi:hypothetical protein
VSLVTRLLECVIRRLTEAAEEAHVDEANHDDEATSNEVPQVVSVEAQYADSVCVLQHIVDASAEVAVDEPEVLRQRSQVQLPYQDQTSEQPSLTLHVVGREDNVNRV